MVYGCFCGDFRTVLEDLWQKRQIAVSLRAVWFLIRQCGDFEFGPRMPPDSDDIRDKQLLALLGTGDEKAAGVLLDRLSPLVSRLVFRLTGWNSDNQDLVQDVFLNIQAKADSFRGDSKLESWVTTIVINRCRNWHRTKARQLSVSSTDVNEVTDIVSRPHCEVDDSIRMALRQLLPPDRELVVLRYLEEKSLDEISLLTGLRKNTIEVKLHRARQRMQAVIKASEKEAPL